MRRAAAFAVRRHSLPLPALPPRGCSLCSAEILPSAAASTAAAPRDTAAMVLPGPAVTPAPPAAPAPPEAPAAAAGAPVVGTAARLAAVEELRFGRLTAEDYAAVDAVAGAFAAYYSHVRFRQGWAVPRLPPPAETEPLLREAAEHVRRIRNVLDQWAAGEPRLRALDGDAQAFLHSDEAADLFERCRAPAVVLPVTPADPAGSDPAADPPTTETDAAAESAADGEAPPGVGVECGGPFVRALVHATLRDALGYVEGLDAATVDRLLDRLQRFRFDPQEHARHVAAEVAALLADPPVGGPLGGTQTVYVPAGSPLDERWRAAIAQLYTAHAAAEAVHVLAATEAAEAAAAAAAAAAAEEPGAAAGAE